METSKPKWINSTYNIIVVNSLRVGVISLCNKAFMYKIVCKNDIYKNWGKIKQTQKK